MDLIRRKEDALEEPQWNSPPWEIPEWAEALLVVAILFGATILTRKPKPSTRDGKAKAYRSILDGDPETDGQSEELMRLSGDTAHEEDETPVSTRLPPKTRRILGLSFNTPNTTCFASNRQSRFLAQYPLLLERFYLVLHYFFYLIAAFLTQRIFASTSIWQVAEAHAVSVLEMQETSWLRFLFPVRELAVQCFFTQNLPTLLGGLNIFYQLQMPITIVFLAWFYHSASSHAVYATARRTMALVTALDFTTFLLYPCMPPRLLPLEFFFFYGNANQEAWAEGEFVNDLAAMPSLPFAYALIIGGALVFHSGVFAQSNRESSTRARVSMWAFVVAGVVWPAWVLLAAVATGRDYWSDAWFATAFVLVSLICNKVFYVLLPFEDILFWAFKIDKPVQEPRSRVDE